MSLDPLFLTAAAGIGLAAAPVLWTGARKRRDDRAERSFRTALRLLAGSVVLALLLAAAATFRWADETVGGSTLVGGAAPPDHPPLLAFLLLLVPAGLVLAFALRRRSEVRSRLDIPSHAELEPGTTLRLVGAHVVRVPGPRVPAGDRLLGETVPAGGRERPDAERRVDAHPVA
jgi:hypothetical protein